MSEYCFMASDRQLPEFTVGIEDRGHVIIIEDEANVLNIFSSEPDYYTKKYTGLPCIVGVEIGCDYSRIESELFEYVKRAMDIADCMELWSIWMGNETEEVERRNRNISEFSHVDLGWLYNAERFTHPKCLKIYKWNRKKK